MGYHKLSHIDKVTNMGLSHSSVPACFYYIFASEMKEAENPFERIEQRLYQLARVMEDIQSQLSKISTITNDRPLSIEQAADYLKIPKATLYYYTSRRKIPHFKQGKRVFFYLTDLDLWLRANKQKTKEEIENEE